MRAASILLAALSSFALAQETPAPTESVTTSQITSTTTRTVVRILTATSTHSANSTLGYASATSAVASKTSSKPLQVTANAAVRGAMDLSLAGLAGAALYVLM